MDWKAGLKAVIATIGTVGNYLFGGWDSMLLALVALVAIDYITGVAAAYVRRELSSDVGARGIVKKVGFFALVAIGHILDQTGGFDEPVLRTAVIWFLIANEGLSAVENLAAIGVPIPDAIRAALARVQDRRDASHPGGPGGE